MRDTVERKGMQTMFLNEKYDWDDLKKKKKDRETVSGTEPWEVEALAKSLGYDPEDIRRGIAVVGNSREALVKWLSEHK